MDILTFKSADDLEKIFVKEMSKPKSLNQKVRWLLKYIGVAPHNRGYEYIKEAVILIIEDRSYAYAISKRLYPTIAEKYNNTISGVERDIRYSIELCLANNFSEEHIKIKMFVFGSIGKSCKITNSNFLAGLSNFILEYIEK